MSWRPRSIVVVTRKPALLHHLVAGDVAGRLEETGSAHLGELVFHKEDEMRRLDVDRVLDVVERFALRRFDLLSGEWRLK